MAGGGGLRVAVVTPEERLVDVPAAAVVLRSSDGELTVLEGHTSLVTDVVPGEVRIEPEEGDALRLAVHGGFMQVETGPGVAGAADAGAGAGAGGTVPSSGGPGATDRSTRVTLLAGVAELADQIDVARAERAKAEAVARAEELRAVTGRSGGAGAGPSGGATAPEGDEVPSAPEEVELAQVEAALRRAEVRLGVAGAAD